jgi:hypothetical protein
MTLFWRQIAALQAGPIPLPANTRDTLAILQRANQRGPWARLRALCIPGFFRQTWAETFIFRLWFLLG